MQRAGCKSCSAITAGRGNTVNAVAASSYRVCCVVECAHLYNACSTQERAGL
jgi:hypothetical protein